MTSNISGLKGASDNGQDMSPAIKQILVINPGSTSTKIALFHNEKSEWTETLRYSAQDLMEFHSPLDQIPMRLKDIEQLLKKKKLRIFSLSAIAARGGPFKPLKSGTYRITEKVLNDVQEGRVQSDHISSIAVILADHLARPYSLPSFFSDPVSVDEFEPIARYSGLPDLERRSLLHALNIKMSARKTALYLSKSLDDLNLIIAHLGGGISVCAMKKGRMIDVNNANEEGPFSPERCGSVPCLSLIRLCYSGKFDYTSLKKKMINQGGLSAYLSTNHLPEIWKQIDSGDSEARMVLEAMAYQIAKEIGSMSTVLSGRVDAIVLTGGLCHDDRLLAWIEERVAFIAPIVRFPGEFEMEALAAGALRVLNGDEEEMEY